MDLHDLSGVMSATGPFVTVHVTSESAIEQAQHKYDLEWKEVSSRLESLGVDVATRDAVHAARGQHSDGESRFVVATVADATVRLAVSLGTPARALTVEVADLPRLLPVADDLTTQVPHVVVLADRTGADVTAYYDSSRTGGDVVVKGHAPDITKVPVGGWSNLRYQQRAENGWEANAREIVDTVAELAGRVDADLIVAAGDERELALVAEHLPTALQARFVTVPGGRGQDGSEQLVRRRVADAVSRYVADQTLALLADYAQERGQGKRGVDGVEDVVAALRKGQVQTLLVTTDAAAYSTLIYGPEPAMLATTSQELLALGVEHPREGPMLDVLLRAALGTAADVRVVPHELSTAPQGGVGAILRYADSLGTTAAQQ